MVLRAAALSPDGKRLALVTEAFGPIKVWDVESGKAPLTLRLSQLGVGGIAFDVQRLQERMVRNVRARTSPGSSSG